MSVEKFTKRPPSFFYRIYKQLVRWSILKNINCARNHDRYVVKNVSKKNLLQFKTIVNFSKYHSINTKITSPKLTFPPGGVARQWLQKTSTKAHHLQHKTANASLDRAASFIGYKHVLRKFATLNGSAIQWNLCYGKSLSTKTVLFVRTINKLQQSAYHHDVCIMLPVISL